MAQTSKRGWADPEADASLEARGLLCRLGEEQAEQATGISRSALLRLGCGLPVRAGTLALLREYLAASTSARAAAE